MSIPNRINFQRDDGTWDSREATPEELNNLVMEEINMLFKHDHKTCTECNGSIKIHKDVSEGILHLLCTNQECVRFSVPDSYHIH